MKKILLILIVTLTILAVGCNNNIDINATFYPQSTVNPYTGNKQWSTDDQSILITYPHTWFANTDSYALVQLFTPLGDITPDYREYIVIGIMEPLEGDTALSIADTSWEDMKSMFPDLELLQSEKQTVAGYEMEYRYFGGHVNSDMVGPEGEYVWYQYSFLASGLSYSITFACAKETEAIYKPDFDFVLQEMVLNV